MSFLLELNHICKQYVIGEQSLSVLKNIHLQVRPGEMIAIMGHSGSGKSTLMNIIGLLDHCSSGDYFFSGTEITALSERTLASIRNHRLGFVFQSFFLLPRMNALENVMLPLLYRALPRSLAKQKAMAMLDKVGMAAWWRHHAHQLSGGQQQRVAIARALVGDPELILADEPTGALDSNTSKEIMSLLLSLNQVDQRTVLIITHDPMISAYCQRTLQMQDGCLYG